MKPILAVLLAFPLFVQAQFTKGTMFTGGSASFSDQNSQGVGSGQTDNTTNFGLSPKLGYMISDRWALGITLGYTGSRQTYAPSTVYDTDGQRYEVVTNDKYKSNTFSSGIFARRFIAISDKFLFALEGSVNFSRTNSGYTQNVAPVGGGSAFTQNGNTQYYSIGALARPLFIFFPSPRWGLEAGFGSVSFTHQRYLDKSAGLAGQNTLSVSGTSSTTFGIYYYFNRK